MTGPARHWTSGHHDREQYAGRKAALNNKNGYPGQPSYDDTHYGARCSIETAAAKVRRASMGFNPSLAPAYFPAAGTDPLLMYAVILAGVMKL